MAFDTSRLHELLRVAIHYGASDVHLRAGDAPALRVGDDLAALKVDKLMPTDTLEAARVILESHGRTFDPLAIREVDIGYGIPGLARFRAHIYRQRGSIALVLRVVPTAIPTFESLELPSTLGLVAERPRGLVLVTGTTGSGKSTTLAAMIGHLNRTRQLHIVTIEDPIEFLHQNVHSSISQREVGTDTESLHDALRAVVREDPDVVLVGELRDHASVDTALKAAETGHTVFATLHTPDAIKSLHRLVALFPPEEQDNARRRVAESVEAIVSQRLVTRAAKKGRVAALEILIATPAIREALRDPQGTPRVRDLMERGREQWSTQSFDQHLLDLLRAGTITREEAVANATSPSDFERNLMLE
jgi:twitching motility protein PilT